MNATGLIVASCRAAVVASCCAAMAAARGEDMKISQSPSLSVGGASVGGSAGAGVGGNAGAGASGSAHYGGSAHDFGNTHYVGNREPLLPSPLIKLPIGAIEPKGWLWRQLDLQRDGFIGHLDELSRFVRLESGWMQPDNPGWEELPYWLKGFGDTGYVLHDADMTSRAEAWLGAAIASQQDDGYFGPRENKLGRDWWPHMVMLYALRSYHEATGDERVIPMMLKFFRFLESRPEGDLLPYKWGEGPYRKEWWQSVRSADLLQSLYWTYNRTGETWLLDLAARVHARSADWVGGVPTWHGVNICQGFREPAVFYQQSGDAGHLAATQRNYDTVWNEYGQVPGGMFGADENCRNGYTGPRQAAETCSMVEFMNSCQELMKIDGSGAWADRCEDVAFNSLPASMTADLKGLHYLTSPNMVQLDRGNKAPGIENGGEMLSFNAWTYRCCQHNAGQGWPYFAEHLWMATPGNGLAAVMYAPSAVKAKVGDGATVMIDEETSYPFDQVITFKMSLDRPAAFPLSLRVPKWSGRGTLKLNGAIIERQLVAGGFITVTRTWSDGDVLELTLPMGISVRTFGKNGGCVAVDRGPLTYALAIKEEWTTYAGTEAWPASEVCAGSPWNYGLILNEKNPGSSFKFAPLSGMYASQPFSVETAPVSMEVKALRIPQWQLDRRGLVMEVQQSPARVEPGEAETIRLIPMGCARLRVSAFPTVVTGSFGTVWKPPPPSRHEASYEADEIAAMSDGIPPRSSNDHEVPRFTWWDHKGTTEWVTYLFDAKRRVTSTRVYWFDDEPAGGGCRVPASWEVQYKKGEEWHPVEVTGGAPTSGGASAPSAYPVRKDAWCEVTFKDVETTAMRLVVHLQPDQSGGILEWEISGDRVPEPK